MIEIKRLGGKTVLSLAYMPKGALVHRELGGEHYMKLPFTTVEPIYLHLGDYVELATFGRFELTEPYAPTYNRSTAGYDYTLQLDAHYMKWKNKIVRYMPTASASETSFHLTATIEIHLSVIVNGINALGAKDSNYLYEGETFSFLLKNFPTDKVNVAKYKLYQNTDFISALNDLANIFDCEWWVEGNIVNFGKCKLDGTEIELKQDENVEKMSGSESKNDYATRIIAFGSNRNLPSDYRKNSSADITQNGVVQKRLMLPLTGKHACPNGYLQDENLTDETSAVELVMVNEDIYPKTTCRVSRIETYTKPYSDKETGKEKTKTYYRLYDDSGFNFNTSMILKGQTLHLLFQSGKMNGMDFECAYNDDRKYYEVIVNENYGRELPDTSLHPEVEDEFILYGWDATKIGDTGLIDAAEEELYQSAIEKLRELKVDPNTYTCTMMSDWYEERMRTETLGVWSLGQPVKLINTTLFSDGRSSRIIGFEIKLDVPYDTPEYIIGEAAAYSRTKDMEQKIESLTFNGTTYQNQGSGGSGVYLITTTSETPSSDYNTYSAARSDKNFLRKDIDDTAAGIITLLKGAKFGHGGFQIDEEGKAKLARLLISDTGYGIDPTGVATLKDILTRQGITFGDFVTGLFGRGGRIDGEGNGEMRSLRLWDFLEVPELRYNRVSIYTGVEWHTNGGGIIESVTPDVTTATGVCKLKLEEGEIGAITAGDMCMGIFHNEGGTNETATTDARNGNFTFAGFCTVYFLIDETGYISDDGSFVADESRKEAFTYILRADDTWTAKHHPQAQMHFAQYAHATDKSRQSCRYSTTEYTIGLRNMTTWTYGTQNIYKIEGRLDGFSMQYYDFTTGQTETQQFSGYGVVFGDIWAKSIVTNSQLFNTLRMDISYAGQTTLDYGEELPVTFELCIQTTPISELPSFAGKTWVWTIQRNSGDAASDAVWNANAKAQKFNANAGSSATLTIAFKEGDNDLGTASPAYSTIFTAKARLQGTEKTYEAAINI